MVNKDYKLILITAEDCPACHSYRGDGIINGNQTFMHPDFLKKIISPYKDIRINFFNVHYRDRSMATNSNIKEMSKTYLEIIKNKEMIVQTRNYPSEDRNKTHLEIRTYDLTTNKVKLVKKEEVLKDNQSVDWITFTNDKISPKIENYVAIFPSFLLIQRNNWLDSFNQKPLLGYLNTGWTIENEIGEMMIEKSESSFQQRQENVFQMIDKYVVKKLEMKPHKSYMKKDKEIKVKEVKDNKEDIKEKKNKNSIEIVQVSYDD